MEGALNNQGSKQEVIKQIKDRIETVGTQIDNFLDKSAAANVYNELLLLQQNTAKLDQIPVLDELEAHPDIPFFNNLMKLKKWYEEQLEISEK